MDIKLGKSHRLRLEKGDYEKLKSDGKLLECFKLTPDLDLQVMVQVEAELVKSFFQHSKNNISFVLSSADFELMQSKTLKKSGIAVGDFLIQVDLCNR